MAWKSWQGDRGDSEASVNDRIMLGLGKSHWETLTCQRDRHGQWARASAGEVASK